MTGRMCVYCHDLVRSHAINEETKKKLPVPLRYLGLWGSFSLVYIQLYLTCYIQTDSPMTTIPSHLPVRFLSVASRTSPAATPSTTLVPILYYKEILPNTPFFFV